MQKRQLLFISLGVGLFALLYWGGQMVGDPAKTAKPSQANRDQARGGMNPTADIVPINIDQYTKEHKLDLSSDQLAKLNTLEKNLDQSNSAVANKDLAEFWEKAPELNISANYYKKAAFLENSEKSLTFAGNLFLALLQRTDKPEVRKWQALEAIECFTTALKMNPSNTDSKIALATCYTEGTGETMKGVTMLREITQQDSTNIPANIILGKLAIQSGQWEKAIKRLELVLSLRPTNTEAMYFLAEAYKGKGDKQRAIELFEACKKEVNKPEFAKEIDDYIKTFK